MNERFLIFKVDNTLFGIRLGDVERILNTREYEIDYSNSENGILKIIDDEIPISQLCDRLKTFDRTDSNTNAIILERENKKIAFLVSGKIDIANLEKIQKREVNFIHKLADYIENIGIISGQPVIILERDAIYARK